MLFSNTPNCPYFTWKFSHAAGALPATARIKEAELLTNQGPERRPALSECAATVADSTGMLLRSVERIPRWDCIPVN